jgi:glycyl-tRNA synthetase beta chain
LFAIPDEKNLANALDSTTPRVEYAIQQENYAEAMASLASLRTPLDAFFAQVTVNDERPDIRRNRLRLLAQLRATMQMVADFSKIDG